MHSLGLYDCLSTSRFFVAWSVSYTLIGLENLPFVWCWLLMQSIVVTQGMEETWSNSLFPWWTWAVHARNHL